MSHSGSDWWLTENGEWRQGAPPSDWQQASDGNWYPPADVRPSAAAPPPSGQGPRYGDTPTTEMPVSGGGGNERDRSTLHAAQPGLMASYQRLPLWARIAVPATTVLLLAVAVRVITAPPEGDDGEGDFAASATTTPETETTTTEPKTATTSATGATTTAPPTATAPPAPPPGPSATTAAPSPTPAPPPVESDCHPSYRPCIPIGFQVDCEGGPGEGPFVSGPIEVIGLDEFGLDPDGNGIGCD